MSDDALEIEPIGAVSWRRRVHVRGVAHAMRLQPWAEGVVSLEVLLVDDSGGLTLVFLGRKAVPGIDLGRHLEAEGMVSESRDRLVILNPVYRLLIPS